MREVIGNIPLMAHGKLNHPDVAERALEEGTVDLVAIGHGLIADPYWANKVKKDSLTRLTPALAAVSATSMQ